MCRLRLGVLRQGFLAFAAANGFAAVIQAKAKRSNRQRVQLPPSPDSASTVPDSPDSRPPLARLSPTIFSKRAVFYAHSKVFLLMDLGFGMRISMIFEDFHELLAIPFRALEGVCSRRVVVDNSRLCSQRP